MKKFCCFFLCAFLSLLSVSADARTIVVSGQTVMINAQYDGVLVSGEFDFMWHDQTISQKPYDSIKTGDLIVEINDIEIDSCADLNQILSQTPITEEYLDVTVERTSNEVNARLYLYYEENDNTFKTGFYVKDHISGVGTLTYFDPINHSYGALGHEITEKTTGDAADIHQGELLLGQVTSIVPSVINQPGEKVSRSTGLYLGNIQLNNQFGIFGTMENDIEGMMMPIASQHQIQTGLATILTVIQNDEVKEYQIEITRVHKQTSAEIKGIEFKIIDEMLLNETGGIIQGMSGSPILQNGRIIGAVTHMIPSSPNKGYGVFIEWMLMNSDQIQ